MIADDKKAAFQHLYALYAGYLTAVCSRYIISEDDLHDVLQEAVIKIYTSLDKFEYRGEGSLKAWCSRIAVNESLSYLSKRAVWNDSIDEEVLAEVADEEPDVDAIPPAYLQKLIRMLPDGYRTVFNLYVFEEKSHREIAQILGIKENSSASQLFKAKKMLAEGIKRYKRV